MHPNVGEPSDEDPPTGPPDPGRWSREIVRRLWIFYLRGYGPTSRRHESWVDLTDDRTVSLDYSVILEGKVKLVLDSGATRLLKRSDIAGQRGTNHVWRNPSTTTWVKMLYFLQEAKPLQFNGKILGRTIVTVW